MSQPTPAIPRRNVRAGVIAPVLVEVLDCADPLRPPARHSLQGIDEVQFLRGDVRAAERQGRTLRLSVPDRWMSTAHAVLRREGEEWRLLDLGSTNGTFVNGAPCKDALLRDGDAPEMGHTQLLFRAAAPQGDWPPDLDGSSLDAPVPELATLVAPLAAELAQLPAIARSTVPVVLGGETGTGKEVVARAVHRLSGRGGAFVAVNCGALAANLLESELFGYRKGAFSGAVESRPGLVRAADGGTLLLDEIGDLPPGAQAALLRVLQEGEVLAVGATEPVRVDVRVIAATHADLEAAVTAGRFRADLFARVSGFTVKLPPLRWRREDLGLLIAAFLRRHGGERASFTCEAARALLRHRWPLNVRELEKCIESALVLAGKDPIDLPHLPPSVQRSSDMPASDSTPLLRDLRPVEAAPLALSPDDSRRRDDLIALLREHSGNVAAVSRVLGKGRMQVHRWVRRWELRLDDYR